MILKGQKEYRNIAEIPMYRDYRSEKEIPHLRDNLELEEHKYNPAFIHSIRWFLSIDKSDLPHEVVEKKRATYRSIKIDGEEIEFTDGFTDLHTKVYEKTLAGEGFGIENSRNSIELVHKLRNEKASVAFEREKLHHYIIIK